MINRILRLALALLFAVAAFGQATPVSSGPDHAQTPAATPQQKSTTHSKKAGVHHAKSHHKGHKKTHKAA